MVLHIIQITIFCFILICWHDSVCEAFLSRTKDITTCRPNTLFDDADDIQKQLDNEVRDKVNQMKTLWVLNIPSRNPFQASVTRIATRAYSQVKGNVLKKKKCSMDGKLNNLKCEAKVHDFTKNKRIADNANLTLGEEKILDEKERDWSFNEQEKWVEKYKSCGGLRQSPINLPVDELIHSEGGRKLVFANYHVMPNSMNIINDGRKLTLCGKWPKNTWPLVYGGAAHSRRYLFHSLTIYWPSEHTIGGLYYPLETQLLHVSAEYGSFEAAVNASTYDPLAFLGIVNIYKYASHSHRELLDIFNQVNQNRNKVIPLQPMKLESLCPPFSKHVCYYGSLTTPPCTEAVLWLIRINTLPIQKAVASSLSSILGYAATPAQPQGNALPRINVRITQKRNDRRVYFFY